MWGDTVMIDQMIQMKGLITVTKGMVVVFEEDKFVKKKTDSPNYLKIQSRLDYPKLGYPVN